MTRRHFFRSLSRTALVLPLEAILRAGPQDGLGFSFTNVTSRAGLGRHITYFGGQKRNKFLLETTGCGLAFFDYDNNGWLDLFLVNGWRWEGFPRTERPSNRLFKNNRDGTFTDVTEKAGLLRSGWGQGCCVGDYNNDGNEDLFVTYWGRNVLYRNNGDGTFTDVTLKAGLADASESKARSAPDGGRRRWNTGCAFLDYDRDGHLDLFVANYIEFDPKTAPTPETGPCLYKGVMVACGPPGLEGAKNILYHNNGDGTFSDVSEKSGITRSYGTYGLGVLVFDFDNDGWPDIYVANDSVASSLYRNNRDGTFTDISLEAGAAFSADGKPQAGMGVAAGDYDGDGWLDIFKSNFAGDTSTLYRNLGSPPATPGGHLGFNDLTFQAGLGVNTRYLGWGCGWFDPDNDTWPDIFLANGHVYPEAELITGEAGYKQPKVIYRNRRNGTFEDVSARAGAAVLQPVAARGCAFGDFDNDGDLDMALNCVNGPPELLRCDVSTGNHWLKVRTIGVKSNRSGIGARILVVTGGRAQFDEVRSGGSYFSQSDLRVHFGLGAATRADLVEVRWPSGQVDSLRGVPADRLIFVEEGKGIVRTVQF